MTFPKTAWFMVTAVIAAASMPISAQQRADSRPEPAPAAVDAPAAATAAEADEAAALIAKANAAAAAKAKAAATSAAAPAGKAGPTPEALKKAKDFGFHAEVFGGKTLFCREDATVGTRIKDKHCIDAMQFEDYAVQLQIARDTMKKDVCQGGNVGMVGGACGGLK